MLLPNDVIKASIQVGDDLARLRAVLDLVPDLVTPVVRKVAQHPDRMIFKGYRNSLQILLQEGVHGTGGIQAAEAIQNLHAVTQQIPEATISALKSIDELQSVAASNSAVSAEVARLRHEILSDFGDKIRFDDLTTFDVPTTVADMHAKVIAAAGRDSGMIEETKFAASRVTFNRETPEAALGVTTVDTRFGEPAGIIPRSQSSQKSLFTESPRSHFIPVELMNFADDGQRASTRITRELRSLTDNLRTAAEIQQEKEIVVAAKNAAAEVFTETVVKTNVDDLARVGKQTADDAKTSMDEAAEVWRNTLLDIEPDLRLQIPQ